MEIETRAEDAKVSEWDKDSMSVKVALRVRPLLPREIMEGNGKCVQVDKENKEVIQVHQHFTIIGYHWKDQKL